MPPQSLNWKVLSISTNIGRPLGWQVAGMPEDRWRILLQHLGPYRDDDAYRCQEAPEKPIGNGDPAAVGKGKRLYSLVSLPCSIPASLSSCTTLHVLSSSPRNLSINHVGIYLNMQCWLVDCFMLSNGSFLLICLSVEPCHSRRHLALYSSAQNMTQALSCITVLHISIPDLENQVLISSQAHRNTPHKHQHSLAFGAIAS